MKIPDDEIVPWLVWIAAMIAWAVIYIVTEVL